MFHGRGDPTGRCWGGGEHSLRKQEQRSLRGCVDSTQTSTVSPLCACALGCDTRQGIKQRCRPSKSSHAASRRTPSGKHRQQLTSERAAGREAPERRRRPGQRGLWPRLRQDAVGGLRLPGACWQQSQRGSSSAVMGLKAGRSGAGCAAGRGAP